MQMPPFEHSLRGITAETILALARQVTFCMGSNLLYLTGSADHRIGSHLAME